MKGFAIGTCGVVGAGVLILTLITLGVSREVAVGCGIILAVTGFVIQLVSAFRMKHSFEREFRQRQQEHRAIMRKAETLPPEDAIRLLLGSGPKN